MGPRTQEAGSSSQAVPQGLHPLQHSSSSQATLGANTELEAPMALDGLSGQTKVQDSGLTGSAKNTGATLLPSTSAKSSPSEDMASQRKKLAMEESPKEESLKLRRRTQRTSKEMRDQLLAHFMSLPDGSETTHGSNILEDSSENLNRQWKTE